MLTMGVGGHSTAQPPDIEALKSGVVRITATVDNKTKVGTGFIVKLDSDVVQIVTAAHVVEGDSQPRVQFFTRPDVQVRAQVKHAEGGADETGMALLTVQGKDNVPAGLMALPLATSVRVSGGEDIMVIGHPRGAGDWAIIKGNIASRQGRHLKIDANIDEGNSGGPIIQNGQVVGLIGGAQRYGKGVTIGTVREYLEGHGVHQEERSVPSVAKSAPPRSQPMQPMSKAASESTGKDGAPMVLIPAGEFMMGSRDGDESGQDNERPAHPVYLDSFYLDQYEVTTTRYATFFRATNRRQPTYWSEQLLQQHGNKPVVGVDSNDATAYCDWAGKRLPTEAEWEKAARGTDQRLYPWGNASPDQSLANFNHCCDFKNYGVLTDVGSFEKGKSFYGAYDMAGNVWEWVADWYDENYYSKSSARNPKGPWIGQYRVIRGGSWSRTPVLIRSALRNWYSPATRADGIGFRCAQDVPK
jgi:formylglycine-generating enzyme required for sulfatase activity